MANTLITAGQFAKLARTTKRTVQWYTQKGILGPVEVNKEGYRFYNPQQIIDFQVITLLRKLRFSIEDIKGYLSQNNSLEALFELKQQVVKKEISEFQKALKDITAYYANIRESNTLVNPIIKEVQSFSICYLPLVGSYTQISDTCFTLKSYFKRLPKNAIFLTIFEDEGFRPKMSHMKVGVIQREGMELKKEAEALVKGKTIPRYKALTYIHNGSGNLLSLLWMELDKYSKQNGFTYNPNFPSLELYHKTALNDISNENDMTFEIQLPILENKHPSN